MHHFHMEIAGGMAACSGIFLFKPFTVSMTFHRPCKTKFSVVKNTGRAVTKSLLSSNLICASLRSNDHPRLSYGGGFDKEPFWINVVKDIAWSLKCLAVFLAEQPNQIKYIEWPAFESTLRTARITLVLSVIFWLCWSGEVLSYRTFLYAVDLSHLLTVMQFQVVQHETNKTQFLNLRQL